MIPEAGHLDKCEIWNCGIWGGRRFGTHFQIPWETLVQKSRIVAQRASIANGGRYSLWVAAVFSCFLGGF